MDRTRNHSRHYQYKFEEEPMCTGYMGEIFKYKPDKPDTIKNKEDELAARKLAILRETLTERQLEVAHMTMMGYSQQEIAMQLGVHQSTIARCLGGHIISSGMERAGQRYGGIRSKIIKSLENDEEYTLLEKELYDMVESWKEQVGLI